MANQPSRYDVLSHVQKDDLRSLLGLHPVYDSEFADTLDDEALDKYDAKYRHDQLRVERFFAETILYLCGARSTDLQVVKLPGGKQAELPRSGWSIQPGETMNVNVQFCESGQVAYSIYYVDAKYRQAARVILGYLREHVPSAVNEAHAAQLMAELDKLEASAA